MLSNVIDGLRTPDRHNIRSLSGENGSFFDGILGVLWRQKREILTDFLVFSET